MSYVVREWNKLIFEIRYSVSYQQFRKSLLSFFKPIYSSLFPIHHPIGAKLLVRLRLGFCHMREHKFRHNFHDTLNPLGSWNLESEITSHYLLCCHNFASACSTSLWLLKTNTFCLPPCLNPIPSPRTKWLNQVICQVEKFWSSKHFQLAGIFSCT